LERNIIGGFKMIKKTTKTAKMIKKTTKTAKKTIEKLDSLVMKELTIEDINELLLLQKHVASNDETRMYLGYIYIEKKDTGIYAVATNGYILMRKMINYTPLIKEVLGKKENGLLKLNMKNVIKGNVGSVEVKNGYIEVNTNKGKILIDYETKNNYDYPRYEQLLNDARKNMKIEEKTNFTQLNAAYLLDLWKATGVRNPGITIYLGKEPKNTIYCNFSQRKDIEAIIMPMRV